MMEYALFFVGMDFMKINSLLDRISYYYLIDISPDVHVRRVLKTLGYLNENPTIDQVIYKAREINPEFPGLIDYSYWKMGRTYCHETNPSCNKCPLNCECDSYKKHKTT